MGRAFYHDMGIIPIWGNSPGCHHDECQQPMAQWDWCFLKGPVGSAGSMVGKPKNKSQYRSQMIPIIYRNLTTAWYFSTETRSNQSNLVESLKPGLNCSWDCCDRSFEWRHWLLSRCIVCQLVPQQVGPFGLSDSRGLGISRHRVMARVAVLVVLTGACRAELSRGVSGGKLHSDAAQSPRLGSKIT